MIEIYIFGYDLKYILFFFFKVNIFYKVNLNGFFKCCNYKEFLNICYVSKVLILKLLGRIYYINNKEMF